MIRFACATCRNAIETPDDRAGDKMACPVCGQKLLIPPPLSRRKKTVLGQLLPSAEPAPPEDASRAALDIPPEPAPLDTNEWTTPTQPSRTGSLVLTLFIVGTLVLVILFAVVLNSGNGK